MYIVLTKICLRCNHFTEPKRTNVLLLFYYLTLLHAKKLSKWDRNMHYLIPNSHVGSFYKQKVPFLSFINTPFTRISHCFNNADEPWSEIYLNLWQNSNKSLLDCFKSQRQSLMQTYSIIKSHLELVQVCYTYEIKSLPCIFIDLSVQYLKVLLRSSYNRLSTSKDQQSKEYCI